MTAKRKRANVINSTSDDDDYKPRKECELISDSIVEDNDQEELILQQKPTLLPPRLSQAAPPAQTQLIIDKHPPLVTSDLAVHKKKIEELDRWMKTLSDSTPKILLLSGPAGCGKTATLQCLSKQHGIRLDEFENNINQNIFNSRSMGDDQDYHFSYTPLSDQLVESIRECGVVRRMKLGRLPFGLPKTILSNQQSYMQSLLLLEDLPGYSIMKSQPVQQAFRNYIAASSASSAIVIILSDATLRGRFSLLTEPLASSDVLLSKRNILPVDLLTSSRLREIKFNPIAKTLLVKGITRIAEKEARNNINFQKRSKKYIEALADGSTGDIRCAITHLQFMSLPVPNLENLNASTSSRSECVVGGVDQAVSLFRALGKVMYNKRQAARMKYEDDLCTRLRGFKRNALDFTPEALLDSLNMDAGVLSLYLNQNYTNHCCTLEEAVSASEYISCADLYLGRYEHNTSLNVYSSTVAVRGLLMSWEEDRSGYSNRQVFHAFAKSDYWSSLSKKRELEAKYVQEFMFPKLQETLGLEIPVSRCPISAAHCLPFSVIFSERLPFLHIIKKKMDLTLSRFLKSLCSYHDQANITFFSEKDEESVLDENSLALQSFQSPSSKVVPAATQGQSDGQVFLSKIKRLGKDNAILRDDDIEEDY